MTLSKKFDLQFFLENCKAIITETVYRSRITKIHGMWLLGKEIERHLTDLSRKEIYGQHINEKLAVDLGLHEREIAYCRQFYKKFQFEDFDEVEKQLPYGKNISWAKVKQKCLPEIVNESFRIYENIKEICPKSENGRHEWVKKCARCGKIA